MASRYFNPRLAAGGAAEVDPYFSARGAAAEFQQAYQIATAQKQRQKALEIEQAKLERKALEAQYKRQQDTLLELRKNKQASNDISGYPIGIQKIATQLAQEAKRSEAEIKGLINNGRINTLQALEMQDEFVNSKIKKAKKILDNHNSLVTDGEQSESSVINSSIDLAMDTALLNGNFESFDTNTGEAVVIDPETNVRKPINLYDTTSLSANKVQTERFNETFQELNKASEVAARRGQSQKAFENEIDSVISGMKFTPEETISIAFDYLGAKQPEYIKKDDFMTNGEFDLSKFVVRVGDSDKDGEITEQDMDHWVKSELAKAAKGSYKDYYNDYNQENADSEANSDEAKTNAYYEDGKRFIENLTGEFDGQELKGLKYNGKLISEVAFNQDMIIIDVVEKTVGDEQLTASYNFDVNNVIDLKKLTNIYLTGTYGTDSKIDAAILKVQQASDDEFKTGQQRFRELFGEPMQVQMPIINNNDN